ncbi:MAG: serine/threonine protein phosphatase PrpC [Chlamydiales bacterium]|jgi:serine/threonine protein phosphatase PrpC
MTKNPPSTCIVSSALSDIGLVRANNEDYWGEQPRLCLYVLADGMGGHCAGEVAAKEAVCQFLQTVERSLETQQFESSHDNIKQVLKYAARQANWIVYQKSLQMEKLRGMGTTLCATFFFEEGFAAILHVGDSRIYRLRGDTLEQITEDHSLVRNIIGSGNLDAAEGEMFSFRNLITRSIGNNARVNPSVSICETFVGDVFLMCSDGLSDYVSKKDIQKLISHSDTLEKASTALVNKANDLGGQDNITVVLMKLEDSGFEE